VFGGSQRVKLDRNLNKKIEHNPALRSSRSGGKHSPRDPGRLLRLRDTSLH
jgi:hypothetical protein